MKSYSGSCLCGHVQYVAKGKPSFPHLCSCQICQRWAGAPTVAWVEFPLETFSWVTSADKPDFFASSEHTKRGHCPRCGSSICAIDEGYDKISISMSSLDDSSSLKLGKQHSYQSELPAWVPWNLETQT